MRKPILIAGAGLGGLAAALALARSGFEVELFEARAEPAEAGAGIQISANGMKALRFLGLEDAVAAAGCRPEQLLLRLPHSGRVVARVPLGAAHAARFGAAYVNLHRADLHRILFDAVKQHPSIRVELGARVARTAHAPSSVALELEDGVRAEGAALIGADGIHSTVREDVAGTDHPTFTGMMAWRAVVPATAHERERPPESTVWMGRGRHLVHYPIAGGAQINLVGVVERPDWEDEAWTDQGTPAEMRADFPNWHRSVEELLARVETPWRWALHERRSLSVWSAGRAALLGDACHAMPPFLAQGACMALEDAVVLARRMAAQPGDLTHALRDYAEARRERTAKVQAASWANAWRFHLKGSLTRFCVYGAVGLHDRLRPGRMGRMFDWVYDYDPATA